MTRIDAVVPARCPVSLIAATSVPDLSAQGWMLVGHPPLMVRPAGASTARCPAELTVTEVVDEVGLEVFERTLVDCYPDPSLQPYRWGTIHDRSVLATGTRFLVGSVAGRPVATATGHVAGGVNVVEMVSTADSARGRGYGTALTWAATTIDPTLPAALFASDLGRPVYEALGYLAVSRWAFWHRPPAAKG